MDLCTALHNQKTNSSKLINNSNKKSWFLEWEMAPDAEVMKSRKIGSFNDSIASKVGLFNSTQPTNRIQCGNRLKMLGTSGSRAYSVSWCNCTLRFIPLLRSFSVIKSGFISFEITTSVWSKWIFSAFIADNQENFINEHLIFNIVFIF